MSYADCVSRISTLESLMRKVDTGWATSGYSMANVAGVVTRDSLFSGVLESLTGQGAPAPAPEVSANALLGPSTGAAAGGTNAVGHKFNVVGRLAGVSQSLAFESPLPNGKVSQGFGPTNEALEPSKTVNGITYAHYHDGIDLAAPLGSPVRAAASGTVLFAGAQKDGCVVVKIQHEDGYVSLYGHLDPSLDVKVGQQVAEGETIGKVGLTGKTTGAHLHFGLYTTADKAIDPTSYLKTGFLPDPDYLLAPSASDHLAYAVESASEVLARFDRVASQIPFAAQIRSAAVKAGIDPLLLAGLVYAESGFRADAVSRCGACGLTQLMPGTARGLGVTEIFDPQQNLDGGATYISRQIHNFGRIDLALAAYNAGPGAIARLGAVPDSKQGYVRKILRKWSSYQELAA
jgi:hypothetical protein